MRQSPAIRLLTSTAIVLMFGLTSTTATRAAEPAQAETPVVEQFDLGQIETFAGAFLAARTADADRDYDNAIQFYRKALDFSPNELAIQERLMIALFMNGDFDEGVELAEELKSNRAVERVTSIARGFKAIRDGDYDDALKTFKYQGPNDLDRLMNELLIAWTRTGKGEGKEALAKIQELDGPSWYKIFTNYNAGVMAAMQKKTGLK